MNRPQSPGHPTAKSPSCLPGTPNRSDRRSTLTVAEVEVEAHPLLGVRTLGRRHPRPFQPPLKGYPRFFGNLLQHNTFG